MVAITMTSATAFAAEAPLAVIVRSARPAYRLQLGAYKLERPRLFSIGPTPFRYSLDEQVAYFVTHEPGAAVGSLDRRSGPIELASLQVRLPF
jgi:hypothetical protein